MKLMVLALLFSANAFAGFEQFTGRFSATCENDNSRTYDVLSAYDAVTNTLTLAEVEPNADRYTFGARFDKINEGKQVEKYDSETFGCAKRMNQTIFKDGTISKAMKVKKCIIPYVIDWHNQSLTVIEDGKLILETNSEFLNSKCTLIKK